MMKKICLLTISILMCFALTVISVSAADISLGDVSGDGKITASDARLALRAAADLDKLSETQKACADVNGDIKVTAADARILLRIAAGLDSIDNYVKEEPQEPTATTQPPETTTKEPETTTLPPETTTQPPETTTKAPETTTLPPETTTQPPEETAVDLADYLGKHIDEFIDDFSEYEYDKDVNTYIFGETVGVETDHKDIIVYICYSYTQHDETEYSCFGVTQGQTEAEAEAAIKNKGFVKEDEESSMWYNEASDRYIVFESEDGIITYITIATGQYLDMTLNSDDIQYLLFEEKSYIMDVIPGLKYNPGNGAYSSDCVTVIFDRNGVTQFVSIDDECDFKILGATVGMDKEEAAYYCTEETFDNTDKSFLTVCDYVAGIKVIMYYDKNGIITQITAVKDIHNVEDYLGWEYEEIIETFPDLVYVDGIYRNGTFGFALKNNKVVEAGILYFSMSNVYSCYVGQSYNDAVDVLEDQGFEYYTTSDEGFIFYVNYAQEQIMYMFKSNEGLVSFVCAVAYYQ